MKRHPKPVQVSSYKGEMERNRGKMEIYWHFLGFREKFSLLNNNEIIQLWNMGDLAQVLHTYLIMLSRREILAQLRKMGVREQSLLKAYLRDFERYMKANYGLEIGKKGKTGSKGKASEIRHD